MNESHDSLRHFYEVSSHELDWLTDYARQQPGVLGSRMTGAGFGGCTVTLLKDSSLDEFEREISKRYQAKTGLIAQIYRVRPGQPARILSYRERMSDSLAALARGGLAPTGRALASSRAACSSTKSSNAL